MLEQLVNLIPWLHSQLCVKLLSLYGKEEEAYGEAVLNTFIFQLYSNDDA